MTWLLGLAPTVRRAVVAVAIFCLLAVAIVTLSVCSERGRMDSNVAAATGKALDKVAAETPVIRQDQQEKQREVDKLEGADQPLPDGFGADLERVRRGNHSRQP